MKSLVATGTCRPGLLKPQGMLRDSLTMQQALLWLPPLTL